jgi:hypothetical protein
MNYRRGFIRVWIVGTTCWIVYWAWHYMTTCELDHMSSAVGEIQAITCHWEGVGQGDWVPIGETGPVLRELRVMAIRALGPPICLQALAARDCPLRLYGRRGA